MQVSGVVSMTLTTAVSAMLSALVILIVSPLSIVAVLPLGYVYYRVQVRPLRPPAGSACGLWGWCEGSGFRL